MGNRRRPSHKMTDNFAELPRPTGSRESLNSLNSPKSGIVIWGEKSLLQVDDYLLSSPGDGFPLPQNPCLTASIS